MLNAMRRGAKGPLAKILIGLLIVSLAIWGIAGFVNQVDPTEVARAGDTPVTASEFARVYQRTVNATSQQIGQHLTPEQAQAFGVPSRVLSQLLTEALEVDAAHALGVDISDDALAERIRESPAFFGPNGAFDRIRFDNILDSNRYTEAEFLELERNAAAQEMFVNALVGGLRAPTPLLEALNRFRNQTRRVDYFVLNDDNLGPIADPTETELQAFYNDNKADFQAPEYRGLDVVTLSPAAIADPQEVSADAVQRAYDVAGAYGAPEKRRVQQVILSDRATADAAVADINNGKAFADVLAGMGRAMSDVDLGLVERGDLVDPAVADAAFSLEAGKATAVDGRFGPLLVHVDAIEPGGKLPLEEVEDGIRQELALEEAEDQIRPLFDRVEDAVAGGATIAEIAERFSLPTHTYDAVDRSGNGRDGAPVDPRVQEGVLAAAFESAVGDDAVPVEIGDSYTWVQVSSVTPAADRPFEEVTSDVVVAWTVAEKASRLEKEAEEALAKVRSGGSLEEIASALGVEAKTTEPFSQGAPSGDLPTAASAAAFGGPIDHVASVVADNGEHIVLKVVEVSEPAFSKADADLQTARQRLDEGIAQALIYEFVNARRDEVGTTINQPVLTQLIGLGEGRYR